MASKPLTLAEAYTSSQDCMLEHDYVWACRKTVEIAKYLLIEDNLELRTRAWCNIELGCNWYDLDAAVEHAKEGVKLLEEHTVAGSEVFDRQFNRAKKALEMGLDEQKKRRIKKAQDKQAHHEDAKQAKQGEKGQDEVKNKDEGSENNITSLSAAAGRLAIEEAKSAPAASTDN